MTGCNVYTNVVVISSMLVLLSALLFNGSSSGCGANKIICIQNALKWTSELKSGIGGGNVVEFLLVDVLFRC